MSEINEVVRLTKIIDGDPKLGLTGMREKVETIEKTVKQNRIMLAVSVAVYVLQFLGLEIDLSEMLARIAVLLAGG